MRFTHTKFIPTGIKDVEAEIHYLVNFTEVKGQIKIGTVLIRVAVLEEQTEWQKVDKISPQLLSELEYEARVFQRETRED